MSDRIRDIEAKAARGDDRPPFTPDDPGYLDYYERGINACESPEEIDAFKERNPSPFDLAAQAENRAAIARSQAMHEELADPDLTEEERDAIYAKYAPPTQADEDPDYVAAVEAAESAEDLDEVYRKFGKYGFAKEGVS